MMTISCTAYADQGEISRRYIHGSVDGANVSPGYAWNGVPEGTKSFVFFLYDPHPVAKNWVHWLVVDIPPTVLALPEGASRAGSMPQGARELMNTYGEQGYGGPAPPKGSGPHPYVGTVYAVCEPHTAIQGKVTLESVESALKGKVLAKATITGIHERK
jgi:Raf kinase inhibitor-like YbhB/YbcL family protein